MTLQERIQRSQQVGAEAKQPTIGQLSSAAGLPTTPSTAVGAGMLPGTTPDQAKMMGTPAQKTAKVAQLGGETQLEQAVKLRAPSVASAEDEAKKRKSASLAQAMGTYGDKATELIERTFANITGQQVQAAPTTTPEGGVAPEAAALSLKLDTAAKQLEGKSDTEVANITALINNIATEKDPAKRNAATLELNKQLGLTGANALSADMVPGLIAKLPETVAKAAEKQVKATIGEKLTVSDLGNLGTSPAELAALLGVDEAAISEMSLADLDNALASLTQTQFGETQAVQAGIVSGVLSQAEKNALRNVLATLEERGVAGAEFQVGQVAKDIVDGRQITIGDQQYSIEELLATDEMTDIVTQVLNDEKSEFSLALKETSPDIYNWIVSSRAGLENLVKEAGKGVGQFKTIQEKNIAFLAPLAKYKDTFKKFGFDPDKLRTGEVTIESITTENPIAGYALSLPPERRDAVLGDLAQIPAQELYNFDASGKPTTAKLTMAELDALGLGNPNGLWAQYKAAQANRTKIASIPDNQISVIAATLGWPDVDTLNKTLADAVLVEAMGGPRHPLLDIDTNKNGTLDAEDMAKIKEAAAGGQLPSLKDIIASGQVPKGTVPKIDVALDYGNNTSRAVLDMWRDGTITSDERLTLITDPTIDLGTLQDIFSREKVNPSIKSSLEMAINSRVERTTTNEMRTRGYDYNNLMASLSQSRPPGATLDKAQAAVALLDELASRESNSQLRADYSKKASDLRSKLSAKGR